MRVVLVGSPADRARLRRDLPAGVDVVAEATTMDAAADADPGADSWLWAQPRSGSGRAASSNTSADELAIDDPLTPRELEVLEQLAQGLPNKAIAARLGISDQTVKFHVASIGGKLGASNRTDTVRRAVRRGLIAL